MRYAILLIALCAPGAGGPMLASSAARAPVERKHRHRLKRPYCIPLVLDMATVPRTRGYGLLRHFPEVRARGR